MFVQLFQNANLSEESQHTVDMRMSDLTDRSLVRRFRDGEEDAATALYVRYAKRLRRLACAKTGPELALRADPESIVQSVFRTFFRRVAGGQYDAAAGADLWNLFLVIALNKIRSTATHHRAQKRDISRTSRFREDGSEVQLANVSNENALSVLRLTIEDLFAALPENQRDIIAWRIEGHEIGAIAQKTQRSKRSVERILQRFREDLRRQIDQGE